MTLRTGLSLVALTLIVGLGQGCSSSDVEAESDRRARELVDDNNGLRRQVEDQSAVERAQAREIEALKSSAAEAERRATAAEERARTAEAERERLVAKAGKSGAGERPVNASGTIASDGLDVRGVEVVTTEEGNVALRMEGGTMFASGRDALTAEGKAVLDRVSGVLKKRPELFVSVEGHTDATPLGKTKEVWGTNLALSLARAMAVQDYLRGRGLPDARMRVVGYGEHKPVVAGTSKAANDKNRRVELVLTQR